MKASKLIIELQKAIEKVGDIQVCMVHRTGVEYKICVMTNDQYYDDGIGLEGGKCANGKIAIDYEGY